MTKRIISVLLALVLVLALSTSALAGTITVDKAVQGEEYNAYKIFSMTTAGEGENKTTAYQLVEAWRAFFETGDGKGYVEIDANGGVTPTALFTQENAPELAKAAIAYAENNEIAPVDTQTAPGTDPNGETTSVVLTVTEPGYYLVDTNVGALMALTNFDTTANVNEKNEAPTIDKIITSDKVIDEENKKNSASVGDIVEYQIDFQAKKNSVTLKMIDTLDDGLTYNGNLVVTADGKTLVAGTHYTATTSDHSVEIEFDYNNYLKNVTEKDEAIVVTYEAKVNDAAVVGSEGNDNEVYLTFGRNGEIETMPVNVTTYLFELNIEKVNNSGAKLANAKFKVYDNETAAKNETEDAELKFKSVGTNEYKLSEDGTIGEITTDATGTFKVSGLGAGTYYVVETAAPAGYNKLVDPVAVTVTANEDGTCNITSTAQTAGNTLTVLNQTGMELPSTGGIGTTIFYLVGGLMMAAAVVLLVAKKRTVNE